MSAEKVNLFLSSFPHSYNQMKISGHYSPKDRSIVLVTTRPYFRGMLSGLDATEFIRGLNPDSEIYRQTLYVLLHELGHVKFRRLGLHLNNHNELIEEKWAWNFAEKFLLNNNWNHLTHFEEIKRSCLSSYTELSPA